MAFLSQKPLNFNSVRIFLANKKSPFNRDFSLVPLCYSNQANLSIAKGLAGNDPKNQTNYPWQ